MKHGLKYQDDSIKSNIRVLQDVAALVLPGNIQLFISTVYLFQLPGCFLIVVGQLVNNEPIQFMTRK